MNRLTFYIRQIPYMIADIIGLAMTYVASVLMLLALDYAIKPSIVFQSAIFIIAIKIVMFFIFQVYAIIPKYYGFEDLLRLSVLSLVSNVVIVIVMFFYEYTFLPKSAYFVIVPLELLMLAVPRFAYRTISYLLTTSQWGRHSGKKTLLIGAGQAAELIIKEFYKNKELNNIPVGILDDDIQKLGRRILGVKVIGSLNDFKAVVESEAIEEVVIAIKDFSDQKMRTLYQHIAHSPVRLKRLSMLSEYDFKPQIKDVSIEELLERPQIVLDNRGIEDIIRHEVVLVTGGGGSIGSELVMQIANYQPKTLIIFDIYENNAYDVQMNLTRHYQKLNMSMPFELVVMIGSVYNEARLNTLFETYHPTLIFHAAAYKHVPLMEDNPAEAIRTNVIGTYYVVQMAKRYAVKRMILVSSDKAVRSTNIMGATKRLAEKIVQSEGLQTKTLFSAVRFGNVLNSNGSVIPLFKKQILDGGPVNVTHKDITRYFMTIPEAVSLILQSMLYMKGHDIFVLDMGQPVKIYELAQKMISLMGLRPNIDIPIHIIGLRPGEKLYEELLIDDHKHVKTSNGQIFKEETPVEEIKFELSSIPILDQASKQDIVQFLKSYVSSFEPKE